MKKIILILFLFSISSTSAQFIKNYGIKTGLVISHQDWNYSLSLGFKPSFEPDNKLGINIGVFAEFLTISNFSIISELNYIQKGVHEETPVSTLEHPEGTGETIDWKLNLYYLNISILAKEKYNLGVITPYFFLGPKLDYEIGKSAMYGSGSFFNDFDKYRLGIKSGLGVEFKILSNTFLAEFVYDLDLHTLYKSDNLEIKSNSYNLNLGVYL